MAEVTFEGWTYRTGKLDPIDQLILLKKITPIWADITPILKAGPVAGDADDMKRDMALAAIGSLYKISDQDLRDITHMCCSVVERQQGQVWVAIFNPAVKRMKFDDITLPTLLGLVMTVIPDNLGSFSASPSGDPATDGTAVQ